MKRQQRNQVRRRLRRRRLQERKHRREKRLMRHAAWSYVDYCLWSLSNELLQVFELTTPSYSTLKPEKQVIIDEIEPFTDIPITWVLLEPSRSGCEKELYGLRWIIIARLLWNSDERRLQKDNNVDPQEDGTLEDDFSSNSYLYYHNHHNNNDYYYYVSIVLLFLVFS